MSRGGARVNSGPPPDPEALRRDRPSDRDGWTDLPAEGRNGPAPEFPLGAYLGGLWADGDADLPLLSDLAERELVVWEAVWATPQAVVWQRLGWTHEVALYVRLLVLAEIGNAKAMSEARQWSDRLGLNPAAMLRNRWRIVRDQVADARTRTAARPEPTGESVRDRLKALRDGDA
jgi:hypothetical protein